ncbi:MAG: transposase [Actinomycetota bacterium]|nr:transposase [Actinomycetota bacterium]MDQ3900940.1 transposase [Actinomycetota bacterium]
MAGFDETGLRVAGTLHWVHCARTGKYTLITCHRKRGREGIDDAGVLGRFGGVAVHDAWAPYDTYLDIEHQLCCAHALRELAAVTDAAAPDDWSWADQAADALVAMHKLVAEAIATAAANAVNPQALTEQLRLYRSAVQIGLIHTAARLDAVMRKHNALARRLPDRQDDYLRFISDWRIPADNNGSERDPYDQTSPEGVRLPPLTHRSQTVLRHPQLPIHRRQTWQALIRHPRDACRKTPRAASTH